MNTVRLGSIDKKYRLLLYTRGGPKYPDFSHSCLSMYCYLHIFHMSKNKNIKL